MSGQTGASKEQSATSFSQMGRLNLNERWPRKASDGSRRTAQGGGAPWHILFLCRTAGGRRSASSWFWLDEREKEVEWGPLVEANNHHHHQHQSDQLKVCVLIVIGRRGGGFGENTMVAAAAAPAPRLFFSNSGGRDSRLMVTIIINVTLAD